MAETYSLEDVLAIAKIHPFYAPDIQYPPDPDNVRAVLNQTARGPTKVDLKSQPLLRKRDLYSAIERLVNDTSPQNTYRRSVYASMTGGGFGSKPLFFATDVHENRRQRAHFGRFLQATGIVSHEDWVLTAHSCGRLFRALDLISEVLENAGASILIAGNNMLPAEVAQIIAKYHVNVLTGSSSQVVQVVHHISTLPQDERDLIKLDKIIYTSEVLTVAQRAHIRAALGTVKICSLLGSAEAGPWAASSPDLTGTEAVTSHEDFVFDTRAMLVEILPHSFEEDGSDPQPLPEGEQGIIVQTSLSRLRNPLVRYITGDVGSLHPLSEHAKAMIPETDWQYFRVLRLQGRDRRFSFNWDGNYFHFEDLTALMNNEECGILEWQVILGNLKPSMSPELTLEIRLLCSPRNERVLPKQALVERMRLFFHVSPTRNDHKFRMVFLGDLNGFERSNTGGKVIKFVDRSD